MADVGPIDHRRYRRRILGWGLLALLVAFAVPAVFALRSVSDDLERRVPEALADAGIDGVTAQFSGQDGTLVCAVPLAEAESAIAVASDVRGVRTVDLDESCRRAGSGGGDEGSTDTAATTPATAATEASVPPSEPTATEATAPPTVPAVETIADLVAADPQFDQLSTLLATTGLTDTLGVGGPFTLLAPTDDAFDAAFDAVGADAFQDFVSDDDQLRSVLLHHVTTGAIPAAAFEPGPLTMLDGSIVTVGIGPTGDVTFTSGGIAASTVDETGIDIEAANGVVHAIDRLLPASIIDLGAAPGSESAGFTVEVGTGRIVLGGVVASQAQRGQLLTAAEAFVDREPMVDELVDELVVDASATVADDDVERVSQIVETFPDALLLGLITVEPSGDGDAGEVRLLGVVADEQSRETIANAGREGGLDVELSVREEPEPTVSIDELQTMLDEVVEETPFVFEPDSTDLVEGSDDIIDEVAAVLGAIDVAGGDGDAAGGPSVTVTVIGHTDSDGDADRNLLISEGRALRVLEALVEAGVSVELLTAEGRGETEPVVGDDGEEDRAASRRVVFLVEASP